MRPTARPGQRDRGLSWSSRASRASGRPRCGPRPPAGPVRRAGTCSPAARPLPTPGSPHVGLADLLRSVPDDAFARLPAPQRRALGVALLREEAGGIDLDPRAVGTGLTALLGLIAGDGPLMLAVDDAQWLDPASARALGFALRRLDDPQLRLVTTVRTEGPAGQRTGAFAAVEASLDRQTITRVEVGPLSVAAHPPDVRPHARLVVRPAGAGPDPPGRGRQPVLRPGDRPGGAAPRRAAAEPAAAHPRRPPRPGAAAAAPAPPGHP